MRDVRIELYRCLCMAGVVMLHALTQGGYADAHRGLDNLMTPSVVGFVFISGYFGIKCKLKSLLKLLGVGLSSWMVLAIVSGRFNSSFGICGFWWFLWMYLALMALTPIANTLFNGNSSRGIMYKALPLLLVVFVWSYAATKIPVLKTVVPSVNGFSPFGVLTFLAVYVAARVSRLYEDRLQTKWLFMSAVVSGAFCWIGFYHYNSPFALIFAGSMFYLVKRMPVANVGGFVGKMILAISPSMFSVYLLHTNVLGFEMLRKMEDSLMASAWNYWLMSFTVSSVIFVVGVVLDMPRRFIVGIVARKFNR